MRFFDSSINVYGKSIPLLFASSTINIDDTQQNNSEQPCSGPTHAY